VLYAGTFSKVLFPAIRLAYLVVPRRRWSASAQCALFSSRAGPLTQHIVADFMAEAISPATSSACAASMPSAAPMAIAGLEGVLHSTSESIRRPAACIFIAPAGPPLGPAAGRKMRQHGMFSRALSSACWHRAPVWRQ
jgi:GntR family transcriptional regulator/MocR family aminotransferase